MELKQIAQDQVENQMSEADQFKELHHKAGANLRPGISYYIVSSKWLKAYESFIFFDYQDGQLLD